MNIYVWIKAFHIISVIAWMAAFLYLPRLFVYHVMNRSNAVLVDLLKTMERRLYRVIMTPAMIASWGFGLWLVALQGPHVWAESWFHGKAVLVLALTGIHGYLGKQVRVFANDQNTRGHQFFRIINEIPAVLMIAIVILVVVRPF